MQGVQDSDNACSPADSEIDHFSGVYFILLAHFSSRLTS